MVEKIIVATHNNHKLTEIKEIIGEFVTLISLRDLGFEDEIIESGESLNENAKIKSDAIFSAVGGNVLADDSGLEVDALGGEPGVYSSRYAGLECDDQKNMSKLLSKLLEVENRAAQFRTVLSLKWGNEQFFFEGIVRGTISKNRRGNNGFGYDPIFIPDGFDKTFAELEPSEKNKLSHRYLALLKFKDFISNVSK